MTPKVYNQCREEPPEDAVYVGRPSKFGNPFVVGVHGTRAEVIEKYRQYVLNSPMLLRAVKTELRGKALVCWCVPKPCHANVLVELANEDET